MAVLARKMRRSVPGVGGGRAAGGSARLLAVLALVAVAGCGADGGSREGDAATASAPGAAAAETADDAPVPGTPAGGLEAWIEDVRAGLADLPASALEDASAARQLALDLYLGRQEYIEVYFGAAGAGAAHPELSSAVAEAEARFHELFRLLGSSPPPDSGAVAAAVAAITDEHGRVLERARDAGVPLDPRHSEAAPR